MERVVGDFISEYGDAIDQSRVLNAQRWGGSGTSSKGNFTEMNNWLKDRKGFLDNQIGAMN